MQAVLLIELFTRFRGRKAIVHSSSQFEALYNRVRSLILSESPTNHFP